MSGTDTFFSLVALAMVLVLALRGFSSHQVSAAKTIRLIVIWVAIIGGLALLLSWWGV